MKKLLAIFLVLTLMLAVTSFASAAEGDKQLCFVMPNATHGFMAAAIQCAQTGLEAGKANNPGVEPRLLTSADASEQNNQLDTLINEKVDTIVLWPHNGDDLRAGAQKVLDAGIPLVVFDRLIADIEPISEVDMDNVEYGASSARFLNEFFKDRLDAGEKIQVLEFRGDMSTASTMRSDGFNAAKHENIEIVQSFSTDWQRAKGMDYMQSFLIDSPQDLVESIDAIFTHDGEPTMGVYDAMQDYKGPASLENIKALAGMGADLTTIAVTKDLLEQFNIVHRVVYVPPSVTDFGVAVGYDVVNGKEVPKQVKIGYVEITLDNYQGFLDNPDSLNQLVVEY